MAAENDATTGVSFNDIAGELGITISGGGSGSETTDEPAKGGSSKVLSNDAKGTGNGANEPEGDGSGIEGAMLDEEETAPEHGSEEAEESSEENADGEEESNEEAEDEPDEEDEEESESEQPKAVQKLLKRNKKLTARAKSAEEQVATLTKEKGDLEAKLSNASAITLTPTEDDPLAAVDSIEELDKLVSNAKRVRQWAEDHADGGEVLENGEKVWRDADYVRGRLRLARTVLDAADARREYLNLRPDVEAEVRLFYPELHKTGSREHTMMVNLLKAVPQLRRLPNAEVLIGDMIAGQGLRMTRYEQLQKGKASKETQPKGEAVKAPAKGSPTSLPKPPSVSRSAKIPANEARQQAAAKRVAGGDRSDDAITDLILHNVLG